MRYTAGIDLGSTYTKCVVLDQDARIVGKGMRPTGFRLGEVAQEVLREALGYEPTTDVVTGALARVDSTLEAETTTVSPRLAILRAKERFAPAATPSFDCAEKLGSDAVTL